MSWRFWIDRGGTFTDCIGVDPDGGVHLAKRLSSDTAPVEAVREILTRSIGLEPNSPLPVCEVRLGTTVATNALLERRGTPTLLVANRGLSDVFTIGTQQRPELFDLEIERPPPLHEFQAEVPGRVAFDGVRIEAFDAVEARRQLEGARASGAKSVAIVLMHAYAHPDLEDRVAQLAREVGFPDVVASHEIARELGLLARGETTIADAYLTPVLMSHVRELEASLPGSRLRFMQSSGGLTRAERFRGPAALLSGPAGGVVAAARVAAVAGHERAIAFDMGGTSTDVSLVSRGEVERAFETEVGGVRVKAPMLRIHTVAAGGGSLCRFDGFRLTVGPESAGALPGPVCYGGVAPEVGELALTDVNLLLGRVQSDRFPFPLDRAAARIVLQRTGDALAKQGFARDLDEVAAGFIEVANAGMAQAIAQVSIARGVDPRDHALVGFGGAAGQHVCAVARELGIRDVLLHPLAGLLSAYGIGLADISWDGQCDAGRVPLPVDGAPLGADVASALSELEAQGRAALEEEGVSSASIVCERRLDLRYVGTDSALSISQSGGDWRARFEAEHQARFGYIRSDRAIEIVTARVQIRTAGHAPTGLGLAALRTASGEATSASAAPAARREESVWFPRVGRVTAPVYDRETIGPGVEFSGPALILEDAGTVVLDPGFRMHCDASGILHLRDEAPLRRSKSDAGSDSEDADALRARLDPPDPVRLEVFGNRFMSCAEQMGAVLRNTSLSTNIKERLDYSCAVFDADGGLVANAPHIPVHLGAMSETVRAVLARFPDLAEGDSVVSNDPFEGGSHLPDVTVVTPVFATADASSPDFFVASRGHHADIGGITPGSMPPDSRTLEEEGVVIEAFRLVSRGRFEEERVRTLLLGARHPARRPDDNIADLVAMLAANRAGDRLLKEWVAQDGATLLQVTMQQLQEAAAAKVATEIAALPDGVHGFADRLDDGTPIVVRIEVTGDRMRIDFAGTGPASSGNLNAPPAVVHAATLYVLRALVAERMPLNGGCLQPVEIEIPSGSILDPPRDSAVVGGNVETSQRVVDVLLGALGLVAASQGTMNNVSFGDDSFGYYETIGGGAGASPRRDGASGVHTHMTNTRITDPEVLESRYPVQLVEFSLRSGSGGAGRFRGGDGLIRSYRFTKAVVATLLSERREVAPYGLQGGAAGKPGHNELRRGDGRVEALPGKCSIRLAPGDVLRVETPGGGGFGAASE